MLVTCQACGAENDDEARYCDQCATPLSGALLENSAGTPSANAPSPGTPPAVSPSPPYAQPPARGQVNWTGISILLVVIGGFAFLLFSPTKGAGPGAPAGAAGGGDPSVGVMEQAQAQLKVYKDALAKEPLDMDAIKGLYGMYSQIQQIPKMKPYMDTARAEVDKRVATKQMTAEDASKAALDLAMAAMTADDAQEGVEALKSYYKYKPERVSTAKMIGDIYYDMRLAPDAIQWYTEYFSKSDAAKEGSAYVNAQVDRATMRMQLADKAHQPEELTKAISELRDVIAAHPEHWAAHFNLGQALLQSGDKPAAEKMWQESGKLAKTPEETWRTAAALAELHGEPVPPKPAGMDDAASPSASAAEPSDIPAGANPHGAMGLPPAGTPNPHMSPTFGKGVEGK